jgi:hypothetical protein
VDHWGNSTWLRICLKIFDGKASCKLHSVYSTLDKALGLFHQSSQPLGTPCLILYTSLRKARDWYLYFFDHHFCQWPSCSSGLTLKDVSLRSRECSTEATLEYWTSCRLRWNDPKILNAHEKFESLRQDSRDWYLLRNLYNFWRRVTAEYFPFPLIFSSCWRPILIVLLHSWHLEICFTGSLPLWLTGTITVASPTGIWILVPVGSASCLFIYVVHHWRSTFGLIR